MQGKGYTTKVGSTKVEPTSQAVPPAYPGRMGVMQGNHATDNGTVRVQHIPMYEGRGLKAPMAGSTSHPTGSQGRHK